MRKGTKYQIARNRARMRLNWPQMSYQATLSERVSIMLSTLREMPPPGMRSGTSTLWPVAAA